MTIRDRDTLVQERVAADRVASIIRERLRDSDATRPRCEAPAGESDTDADLCARAAKRSFEEISREYLSRALRAEADGRAAADLREARRRSSSEDALELTLEAFRGSSRGKRRTSVGARCCSTGRSSRRAAASSRRSTSARSPGRARRSFASPDGRQIKFEAMAIEIANNPDARDRHVLEAARAKLVGAELAPIRRERFQREKEITEKLDLAPSYNATFELLSGHLARRAARRVRAVPARHAVDVGRRACRSS